VNIQENQQSTYTENEQCAKQIHFYYATYL